MSRYAILSDIHGNLFALEKVVEDFEDIDHVILLGDIIDNGMQSNEVIEYIYDNLTVKLICNLWGNHELDILNEDFTHFSTERGVESAQFTHSQLSDFNKRHLNNEYCHKGFAEISFGDKNVLAIHGSLDDPFWKSIHPDSLNGDYSLYDIVFSGHSHYPHVFQKFYEVDNPEMRNKKSVLFVNPGSVGQPRNHNPNAQYAIFDDETISVELKSVKYPKEKAMALFDGSVDDFYRKRLENGI